MLQTNWWKALCSIALALSLANVSTAQTPFIPRDVSNPSPDFNLDLIPGVIRAQDAVTLRFDSLLDPSGGSDPTQLTAAAQSIVANHRFAQQQVELTIRFLITNREEIIAGRNEQFNRVFLGGARPKRLPVAVLAPVPLPGTFNITTPQAPQGQGQQQGGRLVLQNRPQQGGGGAGGNQQQQASVANQILPGESLFINLTPPLTQQQQQQGAQSPAFPDLSSQGLTVTVAGVVNPNQGTGQQGGNQQQNQTTDVYLDDSSTARLALINQQQGAQRTNLTVWRVVRFEQKEDPSVYEQVLATYKAIRDALAGLDPARPQSPQREIQYNRRFTPIADVSDGATTLRGQYAPGVAVYTPLNGIVALNVPTAPGAAVPRVADRLFRQAGLSLSDSHYHLDRLDDIAAGSRTRDYRGRPLTPLLWTEDNELPLQFAQNALRPGASDEDRAFFHDRQTIFAGTTQLLPNVVDQYVGRAFLEESINHVGDYFARDRVIAANNLAAGIREERDPERGAVLFNPPSTPNGAQTPRFEMATIPESGDPITQATPKRWQMIIESFAEWGTNLTSTDLQGRQNIAAVGLMQIAGAGASSQIRASDAGNYGLFSSLLGGAAGGVIDFSRVEPLGKRARAGFNPVVPNN